MTNVLAPARQESGRPALPPDAGGVFIDWQLKEVLTGTNETQRRARLRPEHHHAYPVTYHGQWLRVVEGLDPDIPLPPGDMWVELAGGVQHVPAGHFEMAERTRRLILVVDDDVNIRRTLQTALTRAGHEVLLAADGDQATDLWHQAGPDLILTDIHMPRKSGLLLIQDLQTHGSTTPIIAMTDGGPSGNLNLLGVAKLLGSVRTVAKPYSLEEMVNAVEEELGRIYGC